MSFKPNFIVPPLKVYLSSGGLGGQSYVGWNIATIESKDGLSEYALIWNSKDDKFDLWQKIYSNPEDPKEFKYQSGDIPDRIVHDLKYYIDSQDMWPIIENLVKLARKEESKENERQAD